MKRKSQRLFGLTERLNHAMFQKGVTNYQMAKDLRMDIHVVWRITHGESALSEKQIAQICPYLGITSDWLLGLK